MSSGPKLPRAQAMSVARAVLATLRPVCERIEVAGSLRRGVAEVSDVELVCVPVVGLDLLGAPTGQCRLTRAVADGLSFGRWEWRTATHPPPKSLATARRYWPLVVDGVPLDLFAVRAPASWGALLAIRTGPAAFSQRLVTSCQRYGLRCTEGRLVAEDGTTRETPTERDFLEACGSPWVEPHDRR